MDDIVEEMPVVNALAAFIKYLDVRSRFPRLPPSPHNRTRAPRVRESRHHPPTFGPAPTNIKSFRASSLRSPPPLPTSQLDNPVQVDGKLHRSGRHPEDIYWSSNPKYVNKAKIVGRQSSAVDSTIYAQAARGEGGHRASPRRNAPSGFVRCATPMPRTTSKTSRPN